MENNAIICRDVSKRFGQKQVLDNLTAAFPKGKISVIRGASGCGKTTLLRIIAGLEKADAGLIEGIDQKRVSFLFKRIDFSRGFRQSKTLKR